MVMVSGDVVEGVEVELKPFSKERREEEETSKEKMDKSQLLSLSSRIKNGYFIRHSVH